MGRNECSICENILNREYFPSNCYIHNELYNGNNHKNINTFIDTFKDNKDFWKIKKLIILKKNFFDDCAVCENCYVYIGGNIYVCNSCEPIFYLTDFYKEQLLKVQRDEKLADIKRDLEMRIEDIYEKLITNIFILKEHSDDWHDNIGRLHKHNKIYKKYKNK